MSWSMHASYRANMTKPPQQLFLNHYEQQLSSTIIAIFPCVCSCGLTVPLCEGLVCFLAARLRPARARASSLGAHSTPQPFDRRRALTRNFLHHQHSSSFLLAPSILLEQSATTSIVFIFIYHLPSQRRVFRRESLRCPNPAVYQPHRIEFCLYWLTAVAL